VKSNALTRVGQEAGRQNAGDQYTVLLLNEDQMQRLLHVPTMRQVNTPIAGRNGSSAVSFPGAARGGRHGWTRYMRVGVVALVILIAGASAWAWAPLPVLSVLPWTRVEVPPTIATGASFSVATGSPRTAQAASELARRLSAIGMPAFTHAASDRAGHQVMVGPYVSLDEAEALQRKLSANGLGSTMVVDDTLRSAPRNGVARASKGNPALVLAGAPGRLSLAFEMETKPRHVITRRAEDTTLEIDIGQPVEAAIERQEWSAPAGVELISHVGVDEVNGRDSLKYARATLTVPEFARATTRVEGRRVYIDLIATRQEAPRVDAARAAAVRRPAREVTPDRAASPLSEELQEISRSVQPQPDPASAARSVRLQPDVASPPRSVRLQPDVASPPKGGHHEGAGVTTPAAEEALAPVVARFERILPFLQSAVKAPTPDVLRALVPTIEAVDTSLRQMNDTETAARRGLLISAAAAARRAIDPAFTGDRIAEAHQAAGLFEAAKAARN
jgi:hypothetical protein